MRDFSSAGVSGEPVPGTGSVSGDIVVHDVRARLDGLEDLTPDLQIRTLEGIDADLRAVLEAARN